MTGNMNMNGMPSNYWANSWALQSLYSDDDTFMGIGPMGYNSNPYGMMGMSGSIMSGYPMMGAYGNVDQYMIQSQKIQDFQIDSQVRQQKKLAAAQFAINSDDDAITRQIANLQTKIKNNEQDSILKEYNKLVLATKGKLENGGYIPAGLSNDKTNNAIKAYAEKIYYTTTGKSLIDDIRENGNGSFVHGTKQALSFGLSNRTSAEENIAMITGTDLDTEETVTKAAGKTLGGVFSWTAIGTALGTAVGAIFKNARLGAKIGAIAGAGTGVAGATVASCS